MAQFGTVFCDYFAIAHYKDGTWQESAIEPLAPLALHPAAHVFHYASTCFEGFKAYRWGDGKGRIFRLHDHVARMQRSAASLYMPIPDADLLAGMVTGLVAKHLTDIPEPPSSLYLRPALIGTLPNIGAAAAPTTEATTSAHEQLNNSAARRLVAITRLHLALFWTPRPALELTRSCSVRMATFRRPVRRISC
jgi:branched-chain amino acid aminotransferase